MKHSRSVMSYKIKEPQVLYDVKGRKTHVVLPFRTYERLLEYLENFEDLQAMKEVEHEKPIPWEEAKKILAKCRK
jgi:DNA-directed RNA polymerase subunit F